jgi:chromosome partitioning protein
MRTILVASSKGGCGKTTVATNLAAFYALAGKETALVDCDRQASSLHWAAKRAQLEGAVLGLGGKIGARAVARIPDGTKRVIIDAPAGIRAGEIGELLPQCDAMVIPVLPSVIDLEATEAWFEELQAVPDIKRRKFPVAIVANRVKPWTQSAQLSLERMKSWAFPVVATLRDAQGYVLMAGLGRSIFDYHSEHIRGHQDDWTGLLKWLKKLD